MGQIASAATPAALLIMGASFYFQSVHENMRNIVLGVAGKLIVSPGRDGNVTDYSEEEATQILSAPEVRVLVDMKEGEGEATAWGCDLTYDYVKINADYRS